MSEFLASASVLIRPDTTAFRAQLVTELEAATRGLVVPVAVSGVRESAAGVSSVASETRAAAVAQEELAAATVVSASALQRQGAAAAEDAVAMKASAKAAAEAAVAHEQFGRGIAANVLSLFGLRGATLAASAPFLAGAAAVTIFAKSAQEASAEQEALARVVAVLGPELGKQSEEWARNQTQMGLSTTAALRAQGAIAEVLHQVHLTNPEIAELSQRFVSLAPDVAAFANTDVNTVLRAIQLGISGNLRALRPYIGALRQVDVTNRALADSGKKHAAALTNQELVVARSELIFQATANQVGTFARRSGDAAGQARVLQSNLANLGDTIGGPVLKAVVAVTTDLNDMFIIGHKVATLPSRIPFFDTIKHAADTHLFGLPVSLKDVAITLSPAGPFFLGSKAIQAVAGALKDTADNADLSGLHARLAAQGMEILTQGGFHVSDGMHAAAGGVFDFVKASEQANAAAATLGGILQQVTTLQHQQENLIIQGASSAQRISNLQAQIAKAREVIRKARGGGGSQAERARQLIIQDQNEIKSIQAADQAASAQAASAAQQVANDRKQKAEAAARAAQSAREAADQALLAGFGLDQDSLNRRRVLIAERTATLKDDIAAQLAVQKQLNQQIQDAARLTDAEQRRQTISDLRTQVVTSQNQVLSLRKQERENAKKLADEARKAAEQARKDAAERAKTLRDRAGERIDLQVQIAQTERNTRAEVAFREKKIRFDQEQLRSVHGDRVRALQLRLEIAQEQQAIKDLKKQQDTRNDAAKQLAFSFLQAQQGFAANLLSNLLPAGAARAALAGGQQPPALGPPASVGGAGGATKGQMGALLDLTRQSYVALLGLGAKFRAPEAAYQRNWSSAAMANLGNW